MTHKYLIDEPIRGLNFNQSGLFDYKKCVMLIQEFQNTKLSFSEYIFIHFWKVEQLWSGKRNSEVNGLFTLSK